MIRHYLHAAIGHIARYKVHSAINIAGLALGLAAAFVALVFHLHYASFESWLPGHTQVYKIRQTFTLAGGAPTDIETMSNEVGEWARAHLNEVEAVTRLVPRQEILRKGVVETPEEVYWADPETFSVMPLPVYAGDAVTALRFPDSLVLTRSKARKYFGRDDAIGETLELDRKKLLTVRAILEDLPSNTHFKTEVFASGVAQDSPLQPSPNWQTHTYVKMSPRITAEQVTDRLRAFAFSTNERKRLGATKVELTAIPLAQVALDAGNATLNTAFVLVGTLIFVVSAINFVNLTTAAGVLRRVEVGVRKANGASRANLMRQFLGESALYAAIAVVIALIGSAIVLPVLGAFLDQHPEVNAAPVIGAVMLAVFVGVVGGGYPAFVLSSFRPSLVFTGMDNDSKGRGWVRQCIVALQFSVVIILLVAIVVISRQTDYLMKQQLRLSTGQVLLIRGACGDAFREQLEALPGVSAVTCSDGMPLNDVQSMATVRLANSSTVSFLASNVLPGFFELYGLKPIAGSVFRGSSRSRARDTPDRSIVPIVINQMAARKFGFQSAQAAIGVRIPELRADVIGVVPDFWIGPRKEEIPPTIFQSNQARYSLLSVKLQGGQIAETLQQIDSVWARFGDPKPIDRMFLDDEIERAYQAITRQQTIAGLFCGIAIAIACLGLFGLSIFSTLTREREIAVRKTFGATSSQIVGLLLWQFSKPVLSAVVIACPVAFIAARTWLDGFAYRVDMQAWFFLVAATTAVAIACATTIAQALLASRIRPGALLLAV